MSLKKKEIKKRVKKIEEFTPKTITITKRHEELLKLNYVNLSRFVQGKLDEVISGGK